MEGVKALGQGEQERDEGRRKRESGRGRESRKKSEMWLCSFL